MSNCPHCSSSSWCNDCSACIDHCSCNWEEMADLGVDDIDWDLSDLPFNGDDWDGGAGTEGEF